MLEAINILHFERELTADARYTHRSRVETGQDQRVPAGVTDGALTSHLYIKCVVAWSLIDNVPNASKGSDGGVCFGSSMAERCPAFARKRVRVRLPLGVQVPIVDIRLNVCKTGVRIAPSPQTLYKRHALLLEIPNGTYCGVPDDA